MPQNGQVSTEINGPRHRHRGTDSGNAVPFGQMLSYGPNGSPTITITKTLFSAAEVTSTKTDGSSLTGSKDSTGTLNLSINPTASAFIGVTQANHGDTGSTVTATTTGVSTIFNTQTITRTRSKSSSTSSSSSNSSDLISSTGFSESTKINSAAAVSSTAVRGNQQAQQSGLVAGSVIGSMAALGMIGILIWYFCVKKQGKRKLKVKLNLQRRKSSDVLTPQLEGQSLERTRTIMLQQAELNKSRDSDLNSFIATLAKPYKEQYHDHSRPIDSEMKASKPQSPWIGLAMSSSTPPNTPPMPRSNSQKSTAPSVGIPSSYPSALAPGLGALSTSASLSLMPSPLKRPMKPAAIITSPRLDRLDNVSPLSPRGMFNTMSTTTKGAWRRASQALSPSSYQRLRTDGVKGGEYPRVDRRPTIVRNPELEIGAQTDNGGDNNWI